MIVALDLSLTASGYATSDGKSGVLVPPKGRDRGMPRYAWILDRVDEITAGADLIVIEWYAFGAKNQQGLIDIHGLGQLIRFTLFEWKRVYVDAPPTTVKKFATGSGNAKKPDMLMAAIRKLGWEGSTNDNIIDAIWLLEMARAHYGAGGSNEKQREALKAVAWPELSVDTSALIDRSAELVNSGELNLAF
jgi:crossover junction endodeoxyribonuclease RuvC